MMNFLIGGGIGFTSAVIGAIIQYRLSRNQSDNADKNLPGCMLIVVGALGITGAVMFGLSFALTGTVDLALYPGLGVLAGFFVGFTSIFAIWLLWWRGQHH